MPRPVGAIRSEVYGVALASPHFYRLVKGANIYPRNKMSSEVASNGHFDVDADGVNAISSFLLRINISCFRPIL